MHNSIVKKQQSLRNSIPYRVQYLYMSFFGYIMVEKSLHCNVWYAWYMSKKTILVMSVNDFLYLVLNWYVQMRQVYIEFVSKLPVLISNLLLV